MHFVITIKRSGWTNFSLIVTIISTKYDSISIGMTKFRTVQWIHIDRFCRKRSFHLFIVYVCKQIEANVIFLLSIQFTISPIHRVKKVVSIQIMVEYNHAHTHTHTHAAVFCGRTATYASYVRFKSTEVNRSVRWYGSHLRAIRAFNNIGRCRIEIHHIALCGIRDSVNGNK